MEENSIPTKTAAAEVVKHLIRNRNLSILSIISVFFVAVASTFSFIIASAVSGIICSGLAFFAYQDIKRHKQLKEKYSL